MRIGLDFDDTVADSGIAAIEAYNKKHGTHFKKEEFKSYLFEETWNISREERRKEIDELFSADHLKKIYPISGALEAITELKARGHELYIITGRTNKDIGQTELWLEHYFPDVFVGIHFASPSRTEEIPRKKSETCAGLGIEVFIDDNLNYALDCASVVGTVFLFDQPWNQSDDLPENMVRVFSWEEILKKIK